MIPRRRTAIPNSIALTVNATPTVVPPVVPNFGWYYGTPPTIPLGGLVPLNQLLTFDAIDHLGLGLGTVLVPTGVSINSYIWDFGNGLVATGPYSSTAYTYNQVPPSLKVSLTIIDSLGRETSCARYVAFNISPLVGGRSIRVDKGSAR